MESHTIHRTFKSGGRRELIRIAETTSRRSTRTELLPDPGDPRHHRGGEAGGSAPFVRPSAGLPPS